MLQNRQSRYVDPKEGPRHFTDLDTYTALDPGLVGLDYEGLRSDTSQFTNEAHSFGQDGILPWHCLFMMHRLT